MTLWHPYSAIDAEERDPPPVVIGADGIHLHLADGRKLIDGISSWWCAALGHGRPEIIEAIRRQAGIVQHSILGGLSNAPASQLAERLARICPGDLNHVHFASDGSSAVECALKMALQYWANRGEPGRKRFVSLEGGYHGDTLGAVGVGSVPAFHEMFAGSVVHSLRAPSPYDSRLDPAAGLSGCAAGSLQGMEDTLRANRSEIAAVIFEPAIMGAAGALIYPAEYVGWLRSACDRHGVLLIADEIATGFGRTGKLFACDHAGVVPDIMCLGKALTGGSLPLSAAVANDRTYNSFRGGGRMLQHGHTFCGNPIACAAALATLDVFERERIVERSAAVAAEMVASLRSIASRHACIAGCRSLGMVATLEIGESNGGADLAAAIGREAMRGGLFLRPLGRSVYLWPPLTTTTAEMSRIASILDSAIQSAAE